MKLGDTIFNGNAFKNVILNSKSYKRMILGTNLIWSYFGIAIRAFKSRILADSGTYESESILEDKLQEITPDLFDSASLVITPNGVKTSKLYAIKPTDGTGDLSVTRNTSATRVNESGVIVDVPANVARIDYSTGQSAILVEPQRTNLVFPSNIATTQVRAVTAQAYTISFYGTGSVVLSGAFVGTLNGTGANNRVSLTFTPTAGNLTLTVSGSVTNWQLEAGSNATSLIKTISGSVTRNADLITLGSLFTKNIVTNNGGSWFVELLDTSPMIRNSAGYNFYIGDSNSGFAGNSFNIRNNAGFAENLTIDKHVNGTRTGLADLPNTKTNAKIIITWNGVNANIFLNGVKVISDTSFTATNLQFLSLTGADVVKNIKNVMIFPSPLTDAQAIQLTTL